ncbi:hypothetical protein [Bacteroides fragilis]|uniref:hypothetical protein n=1 Tax=Bacteroides fragilis TaxID=817 RepID=UPI001C7079EC|nr:hypothetical protein [Bacteroides fragilis]MBW9276681.1 hypothetical protein [Bacteroides fragilis]
MDGWIKLYRKITENPLYFSEAFTRLQAWIDLLIIANHDESYIYIRGNKVEIKRGQIAKTQDTLAERWKWSRGKVLRFLDELQKSGQIVQQKSKLITLISIVNYELYQCGSTTESTSNGTTNNTSDSTTDEPQTVQQKGQQIGQQTDVNKNVKKNNILSRKLDNISSPPKGEEALMPAPASKEADPKTEDEELIQPEPAQKKKPLPAKKIADMWNTTCTSYPKIFTLSEARKNKIRIRVEEMGGIEKAMPIMQTIFKKMQESKFLKGESKRGWKASFDWVFENAKNWVKVWEGNYDEKKDGSPAPEEPKKRNYDEKIF